LGKESNAGIDKIHVLAVLLCLPRPEHEGMEYFGGGLPALFWRQDWSSRCQASIDTQGDQHDQQGHYFIKTLKEGAGAEVKMQ